VEAEKIAKREPWPNLMTRDPLLDSRDVLEIPPNKDTPFHNRVVVRNHHSIFREALHADNYDFSKYEPTKSDDMEQDSKDKISNLPIPPEEVGDLITIPVLFRRARQQTSKGNKDRQVYVMIVGDGKGMVGLGFGKHLNSETAYKKAQDDAVRNMDWVERFEDRTIWTEVRTKFGATQVVLRPRPVGFGLRCNPYIHRLLSAAGITDISAKVWGSRNKIAVLKATLRLLHAGHAPLAMGDGIGGPGRKMHKGTGLRNKNQIERARGRRIVDLRV
jgi:small subunit ribosomal protein S5